MMMNEERLTSLQSLILHHRCLTAPQSHNKQTMNNNSRSPGGERDSKGKIIQGEEEEVLRSSTIKYVKILLT